MKKLLALLLLSSCIPRMGGNIRTDKYSGETSDYYVEISERFVNEVCIERQITLKETNRLHTRYNHVRHVRATDLSCNGIFDKFYFRFDESVNRRLLEEDLLNIFYKIKWEFNK